MQIGKRAEDFVRHTKLHGALQFFPEDKELSNGRRSPYFLDLAGRGSGEFLRDIVHFYKKEVHLGDLPHVIFGHGHRGGILASNLAASISGKNIGYASDRKESRNGEIEILGARLFRQRVLIIDDGLATGDTMIASLNKVRAAGGTPIRCVVALDRQERSRKGDCSALKEIEEEYGVHVESIATVTDIINVLSNDTNEDHSLILERIKECQKRYGAKY